MNGFNETRKDDAYDKRVELHCHTNMSFKDGVATADEIISQAYKFGQKAVAFTDHGSVRAYPEIANAVKRIKKEGGNIKPSPVSTPADFRLLSPIVLEQALKKAGTELLEPYLHFEIYAPQEYLSRAYHDAPRYCADKSKHPYDQFVSWVMSKYSWRYIFRFNN